MASENNIPDDSPLKFSFSAHLLEDLGVNLYTSLAKALVEFVANSYDADSPDIKIRFNSKQITSHADKCRKQYELELSACEAVGKDKKKVPPLEKRTMDAAMEIVLEDKGHGMTKAELEEKFLVIGRRRRDEAQGKLVCKSKSGKRLVMGRKGLGKLAGFGIAHRVVVASRAEGYDYTTQITLDYDELMKISAGALKESESNVPTKILTTGGLKSSGTRITLSKLVYQTLHSVNETDIITALSRHFGLLDPKEFTINVNAAKVKPIEKKYAYAWPEDSKRKHHQLVYESYKDEETGQTYSFGFRLRFAEEKKYLLAMERGVRVYAHNRLASFPSMLNVNSNAHGFRYSDYLDGIVVADFLDELPTDYIATDRSDLRWETPPLAGFRDKLTAEIQKALGKFADKRMAENAENVKKDPFTVKVISGADLPEHRKKTALKFAAALATSEPKGVASDYYQTTLKEIVSSLGHGDIVTAINKLASQSHPDLDKLVSEITRSTNREFGEFLKFANVRLKGIAGLEKIVRSKDFRKGKCDERALHRLFAKNSWLINPSFSQLLTSDERESVLAGELSKHLQIGDQVPAKYNPKNADEQAPLGSNRRPDLVFLLCSAPSDRGRGSIVVVELKAPNTPLHSDHLEQLEDYIRSIEAWRDTPGREAQFDVFGELIGSVSGPEYKNKLKVQRLASRIKNDGRGAKWRVRDIATVLEDTKAVHNELIASFDRAKKV